MLTGNRPSRRSRNWTNLDTCTDVQYIFKMLATPPEGLRLKPADDVGTQQASLPGIVESIEPAYTRARAIHAASRIKPILQKFSTRDSEGQPYCRVAGSLRRRVTEVHDVDVVMCVSTVPDDMMAPETSPRGRLKRVIEKRADAVSAWGPDRARLVFDGVPFDLYFAKPKVFAVALLTATGSANHILRLSTHARARGLRFSPTHHLLFDGDGVPLYVPTEANFYERLGMTPIAPADRD